MRWFPDGTFENEDGDDATDVGWLACAIARLDVDVLAVQEFKTHARARRAQSELLTELDELTGGAWALVLDDCPHDNQPHQGFLYDQTKVHVSAARDLPELNPHEGACGGAQRPGMAVEVTFDDGVEVVLVNVHTKSGTRPEDRKLRIDSFDTMASVHRDEVASTGIDDVVFLGDFNTNGCPDCSEPLTANAEVWDLDERLANFEVPLTIAPADATCTEYQHGKPWPLDHVVVPVSSELVDYLPVHVDGHCQALGCREDVDLPRAQYELSDHCPLVLEIRERALASAMR